MKTSKLIKNYNDKNKTKKNKKLSIESVLPKLTLNEKNLLCEKYSNKYNTFEDKIEELFKKNKVNLISLSKSLEKQTINDLKKAVSPSNITPQNDFYSYINDRWLKDYKVESHQKYIVQVDDFRIVQDKVYRELIEIIENYIKNPKTKNTAKAKCIKNAYSSFLKYNTNNQQMDLANSVLKTIDEFIDKQYKMSLMWCRED
jgi:hypothetical protein